MTKSESKSRINELVARIVINDRKFSTLKAAGKVDRNGWVSECAQRFNWMDKQEVNKLSGCTVYR